MGEAKKKSEVAAIVKEYGFSQEDRFLLLIWLNMVVKTENHLERRRVNRIYDQLMLDEVHEFTEKPVPTNSLLKEKRDYTLTGDQVDYLVKMLNQPIPQGYNVNLQVQRGIARISDALKPESA